MVSDDRISEVENKLLEASEEVRKLTVERRMERQCLEPKSSEGEAGLAGSREQRVPK